MTTLTPSIQTLRSLCHGECCYYSTSRTLYTKRTKRQPPHVVHQYEHCSPAPKYCVCLTKPDHWIYCTVQTNGRTTKIFAPPPPPPRRWGCTSSSSWPRERGVETPQVEDYFPDSGGILSATRVYMAYKPMEQLKLIIVMRDQEQNGRIQSLPLKWDPDGKKPKQIQVRDWYLILSCDSYEIF